MTELSSTLAAAGAALALWCYLRGRRPALPGRGVRQRRQSAALLAGLAALVAATSPPVHAAGERLLSWHMAQHLALLGMTAPLLVLARPVPTMVRGLPDLLQPAMAQAVTRASRPASGPGWARWTAAAVALHTVVVLGWHVPPAYEAGVAHAALHTAEHTTMLAAGVFLWWTVTGSGRASRRGVGVVALFVALLPETILGAAMTFANHPWYPSYAAPAGRVAALADQQLAGVLMWAVGGALMVVAAVATFVSWVQAAERLAPARPTLEARSLRRT